MKKKLLILGICFVILIGVVFGYGVISYKVFKQETFLSAPGDCFPGFIGAEISPAKKAFHQSLWVQLFGYYCASM